MALARLGAVEMSADRGLPGHLANALAGLEGMCGQHNESLGVCPKTGQPGAVRRVKARAEGNCGLGLLHQTVPPLE
jgi:uncharacterized low-complexity protein